MTTIIIGAGFAGLAAAHVLHKAGESVQILEARHRIGGRAWTSEDFANFPVEFGAELIHGNRVSTWEWVKRLQLHTVHWQKQDDSLVRMENGALLTMAEARARYPDFDLTRSWNLMHPPPADEDEDWRSYLIRLGFTSEQLRYVSRSFANATGEEMRLTSARAMLAELSASEAEIGSGDYRILEGYSAIYQKLARDVPVELNAVVTHIDWSDGVTVTLDDGRQFAAERIIITLPVGVLQSDAVTFHPPLPDDKTSAIDGMVMGPVIKMIYRFQQDILPPNIGAFYSDLNPPMWWSPSLGRKPRKDIVWTAFVSGDRARELLQMGEGLALKFGLNSLRTELDNRMIEPVSTQFVNWVDDPYSLGGYSVVKPGHQNARDILAKPTPPLFWAGEATAPHHKAATVHGAYDSGVRAAKELLTLLEQR